MNVTDRDEVRAIFANPTFEVPTAPPARDGIAWLRASVSRFANGSVHARRRALADRELERLRPLDLRAMAERLAETYDARDVPLAVLCTCFGVAGSALPQAVADARAIACSSRARVDSVAAESSCSISRQQSFPSATAIARARAASSHSHLPPGCSIVSSGASDRERSKVLLHEVGHAQSGVAGSETTMSAYSGCRSSHARTYGHSGITRRPRSRRS